MKVVITVKDDNGTYIEHTFENVYAIMEGMDELINIKSHGKDAIIIITSFRKEDIVKLKVRLES